MALGFGQPLLRDEDFLTDRITIILYPPGAGGKFLAACLGLSRYALLNDASTLCNQCQGEVTQQQKFNLLKTRLLAVGDMWSDLGLAFPTPADHFYQWPVELKSWYDHSYEFCTVIKSSLHLFTEISNSNRMDWQYKLYPKARVIGFTNAFEFIKHHRPRRFHPDHWRYSHDLRVLYESMRQSHWPEGPPHSHQQLNDPCWNLLLTSNQKSQLLELTYDEDFIETWYNIEQSNIVKQTQRAQYHRFWDTFTYTNQDRFLNALQDLYQWFEFDDYNKDLLSQLYSLWHDKSKDK